MESSDFNFLYELIHTHFIFKNIIHSPYSYSFMAIEGCET